MSIYSDSNRLLVHLTCSKVQNRRSKLDPITDLFQTMQIVGVVHGRLEATAPWGLKREADVSAETSRDMQSAGSTTSPFHFAHFGMLSRGNCWLSVEGIPDPIPLTGRDCFLLA